MQNLKLMTICIFMIIIWISVPAYAASYKYDKSGRLVEATLGSGETVTYTYDAGGNILTAKSSSAEKELKGIAFEFALGDITIGETLSLTINASYFDGTSEKITGGIIFSSSDEAIATIDSSGRITPVSAGEVTITATYQGITISRKIAVLPQITDAPVITTLSGALRDGTIGLPYYVTILADNRPDSFAISEGSLPNGLSIDNDGVIFGVPTTAGESSFSITAVNAIGTSEPVTFSIEIKVAPVEPVAPVITTPSGALSDGTIGLPYSAIILADNKPTSFVISEGALPDGLSLDNDGIISGTPTTVGISSFSMIATNEAGTSEAIAFSIEIKDTLIEPVAPVITTPSGALSDGVIGLPYSATISADNEPTSFVVSEGTLPDGLSIGNDGVISGTPTAVGISSFSVIATNEVGTSEAIAFSIEIKATPIEPVAPVITTPSGALSDGTIGLPYSAIIIADNKPTSFVVSEGALPDGLSIGNDGVITGTSTAAGISEFSVIAKNDVGESEAVEFSININSALTFTDGEGNTINTLSSETMVTSLMYYNKSDKPENLTMYVAVYSPDGRLVHIGTDTKKISASQTVNFKVSLNIPANSDGKYVATAYTARVFLWDSKSFVPVIDKFKFQ